MKINNKKTYTLNLLGEKDITQYSNIEGNNIKAILTTFQSEGIYTLTCPNTIIVFNFKVIKSISVEED